MKTLTLFLAVLAFSAGLATAQDLSGNANGSGTRGGGSDVTGFRAPANPESARSSNNAPNPHVVLTPKLGGVFVDGAKEGWVMVSPTAPAEYGIGEKYLSAPDARYDLERESGRAAHHDAGGIKLFTLEF